MVHPTTSASSLCPHCGASVGSPVTDLSELEKSPSAHAVREVFDGNDVFVNTRDASRFAAFQDGQEPFVTLVTCADSRVAQSVFNFDPFNRVFEIRDIGNQVRPVVGSIDYGVIQLKTPLLMLMGHVRCGAIKAAMGDYSGETMEIIHALDDLHLPLREDSGTGDFEDRWLANVERNVDFQVNICTRRYRKRIASGELAVLGVVYDFANLYDRGHGRLVMINLNGETQPDRIKSNPIVTSLDESVLKATVARFTV